MVSQINIIMIILVGLGCTILPVAAFLIVRRKSKNIAGALLAGAISFFVSQAVLRMNILGFISTQQWFLEFAKNRFFLYVLAVAFSAALFETAGRYFTMKLFMKDTVSYYGGISHGIGHGGIEIILLITMAYISNFVISLQINSGEFANMIESARAAGEQGATVAAQLEAAKSALINTPAADFSLAFIERFFTLFFHIGLSLMIAEGIVRKKEMLFTALVILIHTAADTTAPLLANMGVNSYLIEGVIGLFAAGTFIYTMTSRKRFEKANKIYPREKEQAALESDY